MRMRLSLYSAASTLVGLLCSSPSCFAAQTLLLASLALTHRLLRPHLTKNGCDMQNSREVRQSTLQARLTRGSAPVSNRKRKVQLPDGRKVRLTSAQIKLHELFQHVEKLPRELCEVLFTQLPKCTLLALKWNARFRELAHAAAYRDLEMLCNGAKTRVLCEGIAIGLGRSVRTFYYGVTEPDFPALIDLLQPAYLPLVSKIDYCVPCYCPTPSLEQARKLVENLGRLPMLRDFNMHDGGGAPRAQFLSRDIFALRQVDKLGETPWWCLFPSLENLYLTDPSEALHACFLSRHNGYNKLRDFSLVAYRHSTKVVDFPKNLICLRLADNDHICYPQLVALLGTSSATLQVLEFQTRGGRSMLDHLPNLAPVNCPKLSVLALADRSHNFYAREVWLAGEAVSQAQSRHLQHDGVFSLIAAPMVRLLGIGAVPHVHSVDQITHFIRDIGATSLTSLLYAEYDPYSPTSKNHASRQGRLRAERNLTSIEQCCEAAAVRMFSVHPDDYYKFLEECFRLEGPADPDPFILDSDAVETSENDDEDADDAASDV